MFKQGKKPRTTATDEQKLSKHQMQLLLIKKKKSDALALQIVERLLEPNIHSEWLLQNLKHINRSHMEDVIEERAISKLCGYVLCENKLVAVFKQQYFISTKQNKVYDVSKRKNFCSSTCYGASNYLLEQLSTSPLWFRDKEEVPEFKLFSKGGEKKKSNIGEEITMKNTDTEKSEQDFESVHEGKDTCNSNGLSITDINNVINDKKDQKHSDNKERNSETVNKNQKNLSNLTTINEELHEDVNASTEDKSVDCKSFINSHTIEKTVENDTSVNDNNITANSDNAVDKNIQVKKHRKKKEEKRDKVDKATPNPTESLHLLIDRVEKKFKEWITEDTVKLLTGDAAIRQEIFDKVLQSERYTTLCEKLNRLQILSENDNNRSDKVELLPQPHFSVLQEQSKTMELKVKAFYKGSIEIDTEESDKAEDDNVVPLTEAHTPNAIRRKIFLDKLNKILPDLLHTLSTNGRFQYKNLAVKVLVHTFSISSGNIMFRSVECTLVGLIIIKMLSLIHPEVKMLLKSNKGMKYISMILMTYKLDALYLDRFVTSIINIHDI